MYIVLVCIIKIVCLVGITICIVMSTCIHVCLSCELPIFPPENFFFEIRLTETSVYRDNTEMDVIDTAANDEKAH